MIFIHVCMSRDVRASRSSVTFKIYTSFIVIILFFSVLIKWQKTIGVSSSPRNSAKNNLNHLCISLICSYYLPQRDDSY